MDRSRLDLLSNNKTVTSPLGTAGVGKQNDVDSNYSESVATCRGRGVVSNDNLHRPTSKGLRNENGGRVSKFTNNAENEPGTDSGYPIGSARLSNSERGQSLSSETLQRDGKETEMGAHQSYSLQRERKHVYKQKSVNSLYMDFIPVKHPPVKSCKSLMDVKAMQALDSTSPVIVPDDCVDSAYSYAYAHKFTEAVTLGDYTNPLDAGKFEWEKTVQLRSTGDQEPLKYPHDQTATSDEEYTEPFTFTPDVKKCPVKVVSPPSLEAQTESIYSLAVDAGESEYNHLNDQNRNSDDEDDYDHASRWVQNHKAHDEVFVENVKNQTPGLYFEPWDSKQKQQELQKRLNKVSSTSEPQNRNLKNLPQILNSEIQNVTNDKGKSGHLVSGTKEAEDSEEVYDCAWEMNTRVKDMSVGKSRVSNSVDCYEDAWDTVQKQRELQEKVQNAARKTSAVMSPSPTGLGPLPSVLGFSPSPLVPPSSALGPSPKSVSPTLPMLDGTMYEEPWDSKKKKKDLEQRLSSQALRKLSDHEKPALSPSLVFRQQNGQPFPTMNTKQPQLSGSASSPPPGQYEDAWDIQSKGNLLAYLKKNSQSDDVCGSPTRRNVSKPCTVGENINPIIPLQSQSWYHGRLSRLNAETLLRVCKEGSYLVRESESEPGQYSLSIKSSTMFIHLRIACVCNGQFILGENSQRFLTIPEMIDFYTRHPVPLKGAVHMTLLHPIAKR